MLKLWFFFLYTERQEHSIALRQYNQKQCEHGAVVDVLWG